METIGDRLRSLRKERGMTQIQLASRAEVTQGTIGNIESGVRGYGESIVNIARALRTTAGYLRLESDEKDAPAQEINLDANPDYPAIKRVNFRLSAGISGFAIEVVDDPMAPIVFRRDWYESRHLHPDKLFAIRIINGSMEPKLHDGDLVVVNTEATKPKDGEVFAVNYEGEPVVKRLVRDTGQWWLSSDNPDKAKYPRKLCDDRTFLIGEVVYMSSEKI